MDSMPSFMKQLKKDTEEKCPVMRSDLLNKEDIIDNDKDGIRLEYEN